MTSGLRKYIHIDKSRKSARIKLVALPEIMSRFEKCPDAYIYDQLFQGTDGVAFLRKNYRKLVYEGFKKDLEILLLKKENREKEVQNLVLKLEACFLHKKVDDKDVTNEKMKQKIKGLEQEIIVLKHEIEKKKEVIDSGPEESMFLSQWNQDNCENMEFESE